MLSDQIQTDLKQAMLDKDDIKVSTLRLLLSELTYAKIQKGINNSDEKLFDEDIIAVIQKEVKKRKEAASGFRLGQREEQAQKEEAEARVLESYLPAQISDEELTKIVQDTINELGAKSIQDMGRVIGVVKTKVGQAADGGRISSVVKEKLS